MCILNYLIVIRNQVSKKFQMFYLDFLLLLEKLLNKSEKLEYSSSLAYLFRTAQKYPPGVQVNLVVTGGIQGFHIRQ